MIGRSEIQRVRDGIVPCHAQIEGWHMPIREDVPEALGESDKYRSNLIQFIAYRAMRNRLTYLGFHAVRLWANMPNHQEHDRFWRPDEEYERMYETRDTTNYNC